MMKTKYYLAFDIGNTQTVAGIFRNKKLIKSWRMETVKARTSGEYISIIDNLLKKVNLSPDGIEAFIVCNVVPGTSKAINEFSLKYFNYRAIDVGINIKLGIRISIDYPEEIGADRIANAVGGFVKYKGPVIIVDFGTATTFDCVSKNGEYLGGIILPGIKISAEVLKLKTAKLPHVEIKKPDAIIGKNTIDSINSGLFYGTIFQTEGILRALKKELKYGVNSKVIATGGLSEFVSRDIKGIDVIDPFLTLNGLRLILEKNIDK